MDLVNAIDVWMAQSTYSGEVDFMGRGPLVLLGFGILQTYPAESSASGHPIGQLQHENATVTDVIDVHARGGCAVLVVLGHAGNVGEIGRDLLADLGEELVGQGERDPAGDIKILKDQEESFVR